MSLGATRGSLRPGLIIDGQEAAFDTPAEVGEFLRRAYVAGGGGDGSDGEEGGDEEPSPPQPDSPELPDLESEVEDDHLFGRSMAASALASGTKRFHEQVARQRNGQTEGFSWEHVRSADAALALRNGAMLTFRELLSRRPAVQASGVAEFARWQGSFRTWCGFVGQIGLWPVLLGGPQGAFPQLLHFWAKRNLPSEFEGLPQHLLEAIALPLLAKGGEHIRQWIDIAHWQLHYFDRYGWPCLPFDLMRVRQDEPIAGLRRLPLPRWAWAHAEAKLQGRSSLYHLLCSVTAAPQSSMDARHYDLLLFACASIVASSAPAFDEGSPMPWPFHMGEVPTGVQVEEIRRIGREAAEWLAEHLPRRTFAKDYEHEISGMKERRYRGAAERA